MVLKMTIMLQTKRFKKESVNQMFRQINQTTNFILWTTPLSSNVMKAMPSKDSLKYRGLQGLPGTISADLKRYDTYHFLFNALTAGSAFDVNKLIT